MDNVIGEFCDMSSIGLWNKILNLYFYLLLFIYNIVAFTKDYT